MPARKQPNQSPAVLAQRHEPADSLDDFPTPPWCTRALIQHVIKPQRPLIEPYAEQTVWEPTANRGYMVKPLAETFGRVIASDIHDYGLEGARQYDFTLGTFNQPPWFDPRELDWLIFNPPFVHAEAFLARAFELAPRVGVACFARLQLIEGAKRYAALFSAHRNFVLAPFVERCSLVNGTVDPMAGLATAYAWFVWFQPTRWRRRGDGLCLIPPCRRELERAGDYPAPAPAPAPLLEQVEPQS